MRREKLSPFEQSDIFRIDELKGDEASKYLQVVLNTPEYQTFVRDVRQHHGEMFTLQEKKASVFKVSGSTIVVRIPVDSQIEGSFYSVIFQGVSLTIDTTLSALLLPAEDGKVHLIATRNGTTVADQTLSPETEKVDPDSLNWNCVIKSLKPDGYSGENS